MTNDQFKREVRDEIAADIAGRKVSVVSLEDQIKYYRRDIELVEMMAHGASMTARDSLEYQLKNMRAVLTTLEQAQRGQTFRKEG